MGEEKPRVDPRKNKQLGCRGKDRERGREIEREKLSHTQKFPYNLSNEHYSENLKQKLKFIEFLYFHNFQVLEPTRARNTFKSHSLRIGGELALMVNPRALIQGRPRNFSKPYERENSELFQVPRARCRGGPLSSIY